MRALKKYTFMDNAKNFVESKVQENLPNMGLMIGREILQRKEQTIVQDFMHKITVQAKSSRDLLLDNHIRRLIDCSNEVQENYINNLIVVDNLLEEFEDESELQDRINNLFWLNHLENSLVSLRADFISILKNNYNSCKDALEDLNIIYGEELNMDYFSYVEKIKAEMNNDKFLKLLKEARNNVLEDSM